MFRPFFISGALIAVSFLMKKVCQIIGYVILSLACLAAEGKTLNLDLNQSQGSVEFLAIGKPKAIKILGKGEHPRGALSYDTDAETLSGKFVVDLNSFTTGIKLRDRHMREKYLETSKYPEATLQIDSVQLQSKNFKGALTIHGKTQTIQGDCDIKKEPKRLIIGAKFATKISDYGIDVPSYMGITVADEVRVQVRNEVAIPQ